MLKLYTNTEFAEHWPVGTAAIVLAENTSEAKDILQLELAKIGLPQDVEEEDFVEHNISKEQVIILRDVNY